MTYQNASTNKYRLFPGTRSTAFSTFIGTPLVVRKKIDFPTGTFHVPAWLKSGLSLLLLTLTLSAGAQEAYSVKSVTGSVSGTSTLHDWKSAVTEVEVKGELKKTGNTLSSVDNVIVTIPVSGIVSTEGKTMDKKTYSAFKADRNPVITYSFNTAEVRMNEKQVITIEASGTMTMAGVTLPEMLTATGKVLSNGDLEFFIEKTLKMTSFKMKPPTALMGTIKSGDTINLYFDMILTQAKTVAVK